MMFDPHMTYSMNMVRFQKAAEAIDPDCARIFFRHLWLFGNPAAGASPRNALAAFQDLVFKDLRASRGSEDEERLSCESC